MNIHTKVQSDRKHQDSTFLFLKYGRHPSAHLLSLCKLPKLKFNE